MTTHIPAALLAAAPQHVTGIQGGHVLGTITLSGVSLACGLALVLGIRKSDRLKFLHHRDGAGAFAVVTGSVWMAAGGAWASTATGFYSVPTSVAGDGSGIPALGPGGMALFLGMMTFIPRWKRMLYPSVLGIATAVAAGVAGGIGGVVVNLISVTVTHITGGH